MFPEPRQNPRLKDSATIAAFGFLLADHKRASLLGVLIDGRERSTKELARLTGLPLGATGKNLAKLVAAKYLKVEFMTSTGNRYYSLAGPHIAALLKMIVQRNDSEI